MSLAGEPGRVIAAALEQGCVEEEGIGGTPMPLALPAGCADAAGGLLVGVLLADGALEEEDGAVRAARHLAGPLACRAAVGLWAGVGAAAGEGRDAVRRGGEGECRGRGVRETVALHVHSFRG